MTSGTGRGQPAPQVAIPGGQGVQAGDNNIQLNQYIQTYINDQRPAPAPAAGPVVAGDIPQPPPAFQPRPDLLAALADNGPGVLLIRAVTGMRGVGKTQLAAAYARTRINDRWPLVAWINAEDTRQTLAGLAGVAVRLRLGQPGDDQETLATAVRHHLETGGDQSLLVFDNATDLDGLRPYLPAAGHAQILITSTRHEIASLGTGLTVEVFTQDQALAFLTERTGRAADADAAARELARELGYLPLALAQAAAVIAAQHLDYQTYLDRIRALPVSGYLTRTEGEPYPRGAAETILLSLDAATVRDTTGLCRPLINVISLLSPAGTPRVLLHAAGQTPLLSGPDGPDSPAAPPAIDAALGRLASASLLTFTADGATATAHRLIMRVTRERQAHDATLTTLATAAAQFLITLLESLEPPWQHQAAARDAIAQAIALHEHLAPHLTAGHTALAEDLLTMRLQALACANQLGDSAAQAIQFGEPLVTDHKQILGDTHPYTLTSRNELAYAYRAAGRLDEAIPLHERTLTDREQVLGDTHPDTLQSRNNLALAYHEARRLDEAIPLHERSLTDCEQVLGDTHPHTLGSRNNLASAYRAAGRLAEAIPLYEHALTDREQVLGDTHPHTLASRNNLAAAYQEAGRLDQAIPLYEHALIGCEQVLGDTHPYTLNTRNNLARAYRAAGRPDSAKTTAADSSAADRTPPDS
jgi:tetratricopeptide (TPR) repeat protein